MKSQINQIKDTNPEIHAYYIGIALKYITEGKESLLFEKTKEQISAMPAVNQMKFNHIMEALPYAKDLAEKAAEFKFQGCDTFVETIGECGNNHIRIAVTGNTFQAKEQIKAAGFKWHINRWIIEVR